MAISENRKLEIEARMIELSTPPVDGERIRALDFYFDTLSREEQMFAAQYGAARADAKMKEIFRQWS